MAGNTQRSRPQYPATRQESISRMARMNIRGLAPAVPAKMKLAFIRPPKKAAMPVARPAIKGKPHEDLTEGHHVGENRRVGNHDVLQKAGVPSGHLGVLPGCLLYRALGKSRDGRPGLARYPAWLEQLAQAGHKPQVAQVDPDQQPHRGHPGIGEQKAGCVGSGIWDSLVFREPALIASPLDGRDLAVWFCIQSYPDAPEMP